MTQHSTYTLERMPRPFLHGAPQVARLFRDARAEETAYYRHHGVYPIMHVVAVKPEVLDAHPEIAMPLFDAFERAKERAFRYYEDPNWSHLAWAVHLLRDERQVMGLAAWANGVSHNRTNVERFLQYALEPGLIDRQLEVEALFHEATQHT